MGDKRKAQKVQIKLFQNNSKNKRKFHSEKITKNESLKGPCFVLSFSLISTLIKEQEEIALKLLSVVIYHRQSPLRNFNLSFNLQQ